MPESRVISLTTDFGLRDAFVGILHGVILNIDPGANVVDVCHEVNSYDVLDGAWTVAQAYRFFPARTVHVVVVDPGVGSERRAIIAETENYLFVAPDNGVLSLVEAREPSFTVREINADRYFLNPVSQTFHGRDIFAPVAAWLSKGVEPQEFGPEIGDYVRLPITAVEQIAGNSLRGVVVKVDKFGNLITNIGEREAPALFEAASTNLEALIAGITIHSLRHSYAEGGPDEIFVIAGSSGYLEIAARQASAAEKLGAGVGTPVGLVMRG